MMRYVKLFDVEVLHDYFLNCGSLVHETMQDEPRVAVSRRYMAGAFLDVLPTKESEGILAGHKMIFKTTASGFLVGVKLDASAPDDRPAVPPGPELRFRFALRIKDPHFFNYTTLAESSQSFHRFSNGSANETAGGRFLSASVPAFDATRSYEAGELHTVSAPPTVNLFRAVRDTGPSASPVTTDWEQIPSDTYDSGESYTAGSIVLSANHIYRALVDSPGTDLNNAAQWEALGILANQYVTAADSIALRSGRFNLDLSSAAVSQATIRIHRLNEITTIWEAHFSAVNGSLGEVQIDANKLKPGPYQLEVLDTSLTVIPNLGFNLYVDSEAMREAWFGVIEIGVGSGDLALLDSSGVVRSPRYTIRFLNRATLWRYIFPAIQAMGSGAEVAPEGGDERILVTDQPRPLTRFGTGIRLQADDSVTPSLSEEVLLPLPEARRIRRQNTQWYSEIYMSNLQL